MHRPDPRAGYADEALRAEVARVGWYHAIPLRRDLVTPGLNQPQRRLARLRLPERLEGKSVIDVGTWDGYFAFEAERRGADSVMATDHHVWNEPRFGSAGFRCAHRALGSKVQPRELPVLEHSPDTVGRFDVVMFIGVLYHMRHPLLALERIRSITRELLVLETHVELMPTRRPVAAFYNADELAGDPTNWWGPNIPAVGQLLRAAGFSEVTLVWPGPRSYPWSVARAGYGLARSVRGRLQQGTPVLPNALSWRAVFHARP